MRGDVSHPSRSSQRVKSAISRFKAWLKHRPRRTETVLDCYTEFDVDGPGTAGLCQSWRWLDDLEIIAPEGSDLAAEEIRKMLRRVRRGQLGVEDALDQLRDLPYEDLGYAKIDHHRTYRHGLPEVIFARGKSGAQVEGVVRGMLKQRHNILITRGDEPLFERIRALDQRAEFHPLSGTIAIRRDHKIRGKGKVLIVTAGTSDIPVAEEALVTAEVMGNTVQSLFDVG